MKRIVFLMACLAMVVCYAGVSRSAGELNGTYISQDNKNEYITFSPDGKFFLKQQKKPFDPQQPYVSYEGNYSVKGDEVLLELADGGEAPGKIKGDTFVDNQGKTWLKQGGTQVNPGIKLKK